MSSANVTTTVGEASAGLPPAVRRRLEEAFQRGKRLSAERSFDYAHELFTQCVLRDPGNLAFVETMLLNLRTKAEGGRRKGESSKQRAVGGGGWFGIQGSGLKKAIGRKDWDEALKIGLAQLAKNPWDVATLRGLAEVCAARHHNDVELAYLKQALEANPKDPETCRHCARSLARMGQFDQAIACWHRVEVLVPKDKEASRMVFQLNEEKLRHAAMLREGKAGKAEGGGGKAESAEETEAVQEREVVLSPTQLLERAIAADPANIGNYLELAELLIDEHRLGEAERLLERCLAACGRDLRIEALSDRIRQLRLEDQERLAAARKPVEQAPPVHIPWLEIGLAASGALLVHQVAPNIGEILRGLAASHAKALLLVGNAALLIGAFFLRRRWAESTQPIKWLRSPITMGLLLVAQFVFIVAIFPVIGPLLLSFLGVLDVRQWSRWTWFAVNGVFLLSLAAIWYGPSLTKRGMK